MPTPPRKYRRFVPTRKPRPEVGESQGWAVSYSDLLMVLLAFFTLYFEFGEKKSMAILRTIASELDRGGQTSAAPRAGTGDAPTPGIPNLRSEFLKEGFSVNYSELSGSLTIDFPDAFYGPGEFQLEKKQKAVLGKVLQVLNAHKEKLSLTFIGHTDAQAVRRGKDKILDSNLVLSNLRGARAAEFALLRGYQPTQVSSEGVGPHRRQSRSLSVKISEMKN